MLLVSMKARGLLPLAGGGDARHNPREGITFRIETPR